MRPCKFLFIVTATLCGVPSAFSANLIDSIYGIGAGSFELPGHSNPNFITLPDGSTFITGWTVGSGSIDLVKTSVWSSSSGTYSLDMNGTVPVGNPPAVGSIRTMISTTENSTYRVTFDVSGYLGFGNPTNPKLLSVTAGGVTTNFSYVATNTSNSLPLALTWSTRTFDFVALAGASSTINFASLITSDHSGILLDNVSVQAIPEPSAAALICVGALMVSRRRRKS